jgi:RNA polymerase sigma-70 factor (ECF subfamily)
LKVFSPTRHFADVELTARTPTPEAAPPMRASALQSRLSFDDVYQAWFDHVVRWLRALGAPEAEWQDLAQEVFCVVQRKLPTVRENLPAWLYRITQRTVKDHRRLSWFRHLYQRPRDVALEEIASTAASAEERLVVREGERLLFRLLDQLSAKRRAAFVLFEIEGYSCEQIADLEQIPIATVWTRLHHARKDYFAIVDEYRRKQVDQ